MYFLIKDEEILMKMILIMKSAIVWKNNLIANPSTITEFLKTEIKSYSNEATDIHNKEVSRVGSNYTCLPVILVDFLL